MRDATGCDVVEEVPSCCAAQQHLRRTSRFGRVDIPNDFSEELKALQLLYAWSGITFDPCAHRAAIDADGPSDLLSGKARPPSDLIPKTLHLLAHWARGAGIGDPAFR
jgi:hypothetical protein